MRSRDYFKSIQEVVLASPHVIQSNLSFDEVSESECYIRGTIVITGGYKIHVAEYLLTEPSIDGL